MCLCVGNAYHVGEPCITCRIFAQARAARHRQQPTTTRNYLCGQLSCPSVSLFVCRAVTLTKLLALLSHPTEQRADRAAAHPPPEITFAVSKAARVNQSAHPPMRKASAFLTLANARRWRAFSYLYGNACVLYGNASQAASPALTAFGAESRPCSSPPTTLKLAFLYGNAFLQQISTAARFFYAQATLAHERLHTSAPLILRSADTCSSR